MDAYEATRIVYSRIQNVEPDNAAKIMGLLLIQDHGEKEMIRLAFGPEALVHSVVLKARKDLGLLPPTPTAPTSPNPFSRQSSISSSRLGSGLPSPSSWAPPPVFSRSNSTVTNGDDAGEDLLGHYGSYGGDLMDEFQLQEQLSFLNDGIPVGPKNDLFYPDLASECRSPGADGALFPYGGVNWGHHRRSCSLADLYLGSEAVGGFGWKPCLYYARGFCKNGSSCRFQHGLQDDAASIAAMAGSKMDAMVEQQCHELLLRSKSQRLGGASQLMASSAAFPYTSSAMTTTGGKCMNFLLQQQQQSDSQRVAAAAAAFMLDEPHKFMGRSRLDRIDYATMANPGSRQIYLTFPADSTFREEDVSNYFSIYGPVQDVRIPYQQKRMFGFVTFVYPETVKLILAKGNPHFVCDARVLVKPYKEKGKLPDKKHQQQQLDRSDFSGCSTPTGMDSRDPYDLQQLGARFLFNNSQEALLRRKLEEQQQAAELQQAIELQSRRFMGLQLLDLKNRGMSLPVTSLPNPSPISTPTTVTTPSTTITSPGADDLPSDDKCSSPVTASDVETKAAAVNPSFSADGEESTAEKGGSNQDSDFQESMEHNLPDSPFASPIKSSCFHEAQAADVTNAAGPLLSGSRLLPSTPALDTASFKSCFLQMPRFSPGHGAVGM